MQSHGTRGADKTVMTQWQLWKQVTGDEFEFEHINIVQDKGMASRGRIQMIDGVILVAVLVPPIGMFSIVSLFHVINSDGGTKGITQPYVTKSGVRHTAHKSREQHIV